MTSTVLLRLRSGHHTWVDRHMVPAICSMNWRVYEASSRRGLCYVVGVVNGWVGEARVYSRQMGLHRFLLVLSNPSLLTPLYEEWHGDHLSGDGLDNRYANLRVASRALNATNVHREPPPLAVGILPPGVPIIDLPQRRQRVKGDPPRVWAVRPLADGAPL